MTDLAFRRAGSADTGGVVALIESAYRGESSRRGWTTEADLLDGQRTDADEITSLLRPDARIILALRGEELVGSVLVSSLDNRAHIGLFAIHPQLQGRGYGKQLLAEAERVARGDFGHTHAALRVIEQRTELIAWYERHGYRTTGRTSPFPYGNLRAGLPRRPDLRFVELEKALPTLERP